MQVILGAVGAIGNELEKELKNYTRKIWVVGRNPQKINYDDELFVADLTQKEQVDEAVKGAKVAYLIVGLPYKIKVWQKQWPIVMKNTIEACKKYKTKLVFFDNIYTFGMKFLCLLLLKATGKKPNLFYMKLSQTMQNI